MNLSEPILFKPKYMRQKTFDRLQIEANQASNEASLIMARKIGLKI